MAQKLMACLPQLFDLVLESFTKKTIAADIIVNGIISVIFFNIYNRMLCVLIRIASKIFLLCLLS